MVLGRRTIAFRSSPRGPLSRSLVGLVVVFSWLLLLACALPTGRAPAFRVSVVDLDTGRGIPAVELRTTDDRSFFTDSAGVIAILDPDLVGRRVFFEVRSFGYEYERQFFGRPGLALDVAPGDAAVLEMRRHNVAERLYRVTGSGIYRDSELLGDDVPLPTRDRPVVPAGMDSVHAVVYRGAFFWVWGDTNVLSAPLGNFHATGARSELPERADLDPRLGIELEYLLEDGWLRPMVEDDHPLIWLTALRVARDAEDTERLFATYRKVEEGMVMVEQGLAEFDDDAGHFQIRSRYPADAPIIPTGCVFRHEEAGQSHLHYDMSVRSPDTAEGVRDLSSYEAYTPYRSGERVPADPADLSSLADALERDADGKPVWGWKRNTAAIAPDDWGKLVQAGVIAPREALFRLVDVETGETVTPQAGSIHWNEHRRRWVMIRSRVGGSESFLGEVYYFEAETPLGPWAYGQKIVTHSMPAPAKNHAAETLTYTFYNPFHHPELDRASGREILFEGTMSVNFTRSPHPRIPSYDYNQMMYGLDLEDPRLFLPVAVYRAPDSDSLRTRTDASPPGPAWELAFFAPDRPRAGTVPVREVPAEVGGHRLVAGADTAATGDTAAKEGPRGPVRFYCAKSEPPPPATIPLYERRDERGAAEPYWTYEAGSPPPGATVLCHVWPRPVDFPPALRHPPVGPEMHGPGWVSQRAKSR